MNKTRIIIMLCCVLFWACSDDDESLGKASISGLDVSYANLTYNGVTLSSTLRGESKNITKQGFCYSTAPDADIFDQIAEVKMEEGAFSVELSNLASGTTYYVKAFAMGYNESAVYSDEISFTTSQPTLDEELANYVAPEYVDNYTGIAGWDQRSQWNLANVHDPSVMKASDGYYYMYQTDASYGNAHDGHGHFHARRSQDLVNWEYLGATMNETPTWIKEKLNEYREEQGLSAIDNPSFGYWAPVARSLGNGTYRIYYSVVVDNFIKTGAVNNAANFDNSWTERAFIGMMETSDPASNVWEDKGFVICSSSDRGMNEWERTSYTDDWNAYFKYNAIDPSYIITSGGQHWLIYGSWHSGLVTLQVDATTGKPFTLSSPWDITSTSGYGTLIHQRGTSRWQGSEAPEIIYNPETGYYYLFVAYDELSVAYNTRVARSTNINGPYYGIDGTDITSGGNIYPVVTHPYKFGDDYGWVGISHCAIFDDGAGNWFYASQGRFPADVSGINASNAVMMGHVRSIRWTSGGWPVVMPERYGAVPQAKITESELVGDWEHIDLGYSYGRQKASSVMTLSADHNITAGTWSGGTWSYDETNQILTANGVELCLQREVDWEASPRVPTIVYGGYTSAKTYWGKKTN